MLSGLNPKQQEAVVYISGPQLILAGAGSGKTGVLTHKVAYLIIEKKIPPEQILMLTFTNKAAGAMRERIRKLLMSNIKSLTSNIGLPFAGTFHSLCAKILRKDGKFTGISPDYVIYDETDQKEAVKEVMVKMNISPKFYSPAAVLSTISQAKNELITPLEYLNIARGVFQTTVAQIYLEYQNLLKNNHALDFDDLIFSVVDLFQKHREILNRYSQQFKYILIDEYQDTNHAQYILTKLLSKKTPNICVVGDASQSIYAWRGANFQNVLNFKKDFPQTKIFYLEQNYRSTQVILQAAFAVISKNYSHPVLKLWTHNPKGQMIQIYASKNEKDEAQFIISEITRRRLKLSDVAVFYRTNAQSRVIEESFLEAGIPYMLFGGVRFYERKEIKDVLSYLKCVINPQDSVSRKRIETIGKNRAQAFLGMQNKLSLDLTTLEILNKILDTTGYLKLYNPKDNEDLMRLENIAELKSVAENFPYLTDFLENVALIEKEYRPKKLKTATSQKNAVTLMTLHSAKGLEFPVVFMIGMEEGLFPHSRSMMDVSELEEERRLCYVGITRAKENLYLSFARRRLYFGTRTQNFVSRFITDIPQDLIKNAGFEDAV